MSAEQKPKKKIGRPTKYQAAYNRQAEKLCRLGATEKELADFFGVNTDTVAEWIKVHPSFSESVKKGRIASDANVSESLYKRALGYSHADVDIRVVLNEIVTTPLIKHYPPDTTAAIFWLKNRQPKKWRDKVETGFTDSDGNDLPLFQRPITFK